MTQARTVRRALAFIRPHGGYLLGAMLLNVCTVACTLYVPILIGRAVDAVLGQGAVDFSVLSRCVLGIALAAGLAALSQYAAGLCNNRAAFLTVRDVRDAASNRLSQLPLSYLDGQPTGAVTSRVVADVDAFADGLILGFTQLFSGVLTILVTMVFMVTIQPLVTLAVVALTPLSLLAASFIAKRGYDLFRAQSQARAALSAMADEAIAGKAVVTVFGREKEMARAFGDASEALRAHTLKAVFFSSLTNPVTRFVNALVYAVVGVAGGLTVLAGGMTVGSLTCFLSYANQYAKPYNEISGVVAELQNALACFSRVLELLDTPAIPPDEPDALTLTNPQGHVTLEDVRFSYTPDRPLLEGLSLNVAPGTRVAIVGPTGCGKTTLINLLMRFYQVDGGTIAVDGVDTRRFTRRSLRRNFGMVLQDTWLTSGTVRENIAFGRPEASLAEVIQAAEEANAHAFIQRLPQGYDTVLGEEGGGLSQGQKQLLCIARVMLCLPPMLILDEATSSIDTRTERRIQDAFARLSAGRTSFIVAHRLSTIVGADLILVLRDGRIVETGNHATLLARDGFYAQLWKSQFE